MIHKHQEYSLWKYASLADVWRKLHDSDWVLCTGMQWENVLFLHDGGGEYAVIIEHEGVRTQVESFTVRWMTWEKFEASTLRARQTFFDGSPIMRSIVTNRIDEGYAHGTCNACR